MKQIKLSLINGGKTTLNLNLNTPNMTCNDYYELKNKLINKDQFY